MIGLIMKLILSPIIILICYLLFKGIYYSSIYEILGTGILLAFIAHILELYILMKGSLWISTLTDFIAAFTVIYLSQLLFAGIKITLAGALLISGFIAIGEYFQHLYLIKSGKTKKSE